MSTKTTFKRVALVAVAALGFGVLTVAPSSAAVQAPTLSIATTTTTTPGVTTAASSIIAGETATAYVSVAFVNLAATDSISVTGIRTKGSSGDIRLSVSESSTNAALGGAQFDATRWVESSTANLAISAKWRADFRAPSTAGTYEVTFFAQGNGYTAGTLTALVWTITVAAIDVKADATSTSFISSGAAVPAVVDSATVSAVKTIGTRAATILVTQKSAIATAVPAEDMSVIVTGPGQVQSGSSEVITYGATAGRAITVTAGQYIGVFGDGTAGTSTITITGNKSGVVLGVETVIFSDTKPATVTATVKKAFILASTTGVSGVFSVVVQDSLKNAITGSNVAVTANPTDTTTAQVVGGKSTSCTWTAASAAYLCTIPGLSATKFGKVNYTITATGTDADATTAKTTADVTFSAGVAKTLTIAGPATGLPGETVSYTLTATDANGYAVADQSYNNASSTGGAIFGAATTVAGFSSMANSTYTDTITTVSGVATLKGVLPVAGTASAIFTLTGDGITSSGAIDKSIGKTTITITTDVTNPGADAATDAANEATDAANAATDAALAAADAADAATAAAEDASAAVATLAKSVNTALANLKKQITALTALVNKLLKK
jgi:hypothetical protein